MLTVIFFLLTSTALKGDRISECIIVCCRLIYKITIQYCNVFCRLLIPQVTPGQSQTQVTRVSTQIQIH